MKTPRYTINQFRKEFPTDDACLDHILALRLAKMPCCPQCSQATTFKRLPNKRSYQCSDKDCQYQLYPTAGTVFEKSTTSLVNWFYATFLLISTQNGVSAKEIERQLGVTYKTAWRMLHQIRKMMNNTSGSLLSGLVEVDETYIGGKGVNKSKTIRGKIKGTGYDDKVPVFAMLQRDGGIYMEVIEGNKTTGLILKPIIREKLDKDAILITDGFGAYYGLNTEFKHEIVDHHKDEFVRGDFHTNTIEGFFSHVKRTIKGTHISVSRKYLHAYVNECSFRYSNRHLNQQMFHRLLNQVAG